MTAPKNRPVMTRAEARQFMDALRESLGLVALYRERRTLCSFRKRLQATTDSGGSPWWTRDGAPRLSR